MSKPQAPAALPTPPRRCNPEELVARYLPKLWGALVGHVELPSWHLSAELTVGDGGWAVELEAGELHGRAGHALKPLFTVRTDQPSYDLAAHDVLPRVIRRTNKDLDGALENIRRFAEGRAKSLPLDVIRQSPGSLEIRFTDDAGDVGVFHLDVGGGVGPQAVVQAKEDDLWALLDSGGQLQKLLKTRVQLDGAVGWVLRLARVLDGEDA